MKIHLSAVGTSLLRNAEDKDPKIKDKLITLGLERWYNLSLDDKKQMIIVQNRSELKDILRNFIRENGDKASAELSSLLKAFKKFNHEPSDTKVFLYYTKSENSKLAGEVIKEYFSDLGYNVELAEVSKINSEENFYEGLTDLFDKVVTKLIKWRNEGHEIFINVTPGFKGESIFLSTAGLMLEATLYYLHESFNDIVVLPSPPITIKPNYIKIIKDLEKEGYVISMDRAEKILDKDTIRKLEHLAIAEEKEGAITLRSWIKELIQYFYESQEQNRGYKIITEDGKEIVVSNGEELDEEIKKLGNKKYTIEPLGIIKVR